MDLATIYLSVVSSVCGNGGSTLRNPRGIRPNTGRTDLMRGGKRSVENSESQARPYQAITICCAELQQAALSRSSIILLSDQKEGLWCT